jgi:hypothetical protein
MWFKESSNTIIYYLEKNKIFIFNAINLMFVLILNVLNCIGGRYITFTIKPCVLLSNKGNNKVTELRTILQKESQYS